MCRKGGRPGGGDEIQGLYNSKTRTERKQKLCQRNMHTSIMLITIQRQYAYYCQVNIIIQTLIGEPATRCCVCRLVIIQTLLAGFSWLSQIIIQTLLGKPAKQAGFSWRSQLKPNKILVHLKSHETEASLPAARR